MANQMLKRTIIEAVCNQINNNDPKMTRIAYNRLLSEGYSDQEAKEAIGSVLLETTYDMLKNEQFFDEDDFSGRLVNLLTIRGIPVSPDDASDDSEHDLDVRITGRNDPCPCGSGKKYKKCCGKNSSD